MVAQLAPKLQWLPRALLKGSKPGTINKAAPKPRNPLKNPPAATPNKQTDVSKSDKPNNSITSAQLLLFDFRVDDSSYVARPKIEEKNHYPTN